MIKFWKKRGPLKIIGWQGYKERSFYDQWDNSSNMNHNSRKIEVWTARNQDSFTALQGFFIFTPAYKGILDTIKFSAADPHWIQIDVTAMLDADKDQLKEYLTELKILWR